MDSSAVLRGFNDHFVEFIDDVQRLFPEDRDVRTAHTALVGARKANPIIICKIWQKVVLRQNRAEIESGDLDHFARKDYSRNFPRSMTWIVARIDNFRRPLVELDDSKCAAATIKLDCARDAPSQPTRLTREQSIRVAASSRPS